MIWPNNKICGYLYVLKLPNPNQSNLETSFTVILPLQWVLSGHTPPCHAIIFTKCSSIYCHLTSIVSRLTYLLLLWIIIGSKEKIKKSLECVKVFCSIKLKFIASWTFHLKIAKLLWQQISSYTAFEKLLWLSHGYGYAQP